jgi:hypothetical protein
MAIVIVPGVIALLVAVIALILLSRNQGDIEMRVRALELEMRSFPVKRESTDDT